MNLFEAFKTDLRAFVEERKNQDVYAACEAESWYEGIDDADVVSAYMVVNEAIVEVLNVGNGIDQAIQAEISVETDTFC